MLNHSLLLIVLISFSVATHASAIPMDEGKAALGMIQNADLHKDAVQAQGGIIDKDVVKNFASLSDQNGCTADVECRDSAKVQDSEHPNLQANPQSVRDWFTDQDDTSFISPLAVVLFSLGLIFFFLSRRSSSMK